MSGAKELIKISHANHESKYITTEQFAEFKGLKYGWFVDTSKDSNREANKAGELDAAAAESKATVSPNSRLRKSTKHTQ